MSYVLARLSRKEAASAFLEKPPAVIIGWILLHNENVNFETATLAMV